MSRKTLKPKIRPFKGQVFLPNGDLEIDQLLEFITGMGYLTYAHPGGAGAIISDKVLTYGDLLKNPERYKITKRELDLCMGEEVLSDELEEYRYY
jgi:hypothetical protein